LGLVIDATGIGDAIGTRAAGATASGTFSFESTTGAARGRAGPEVGKFNDAIAGAAEVRAVGVTASGTFIFDSASGAARG